MIINFLIITQENIMLKITKNIKDDNKRNAKQLYVKEYRYINFHSASWYTDFEIVYTPLYEHSQFVESVFEDDKLVGAYFKVGKEMLIEWPVFSRIITFSNENVLIKINFEKEWIFRKEENRGWKESRNCLCDKTLANIVDRIDSDEQLIQEYNNILETEKKQVYYWAGYDW